MAQRLFGEALDLNVSFMDVAQKFLQIGYKAVAVIVQDEFIKGLKIAAGCDSIFQSQKAAEPGPSIIPHHKVQFH